MILCCRTAKILGILKASLRHRSIVNLEYHVSHTNLFYANAFIAPHFESARVYFTKETIVTKIHVNLFVRGFYFVGLSTQIKLVLVVT